MPNFMRIGGVRNSHDIFGRGFLISFSIDFFLPSYQFPHSFYVIYSHVAVFPFLHMYTWEYSTNGDYIYSHKSLGVTTRERELFNARQAGRGCAVRVARPDSPEVLFFGECCIMVPYDTVVAAPGQDDLRTDRGC